MPRRPPRPPLTFPGRNYGQLGPDGFRARGRGIDRDPSRGDDGLVSPLDQILGSYLAIIWLVLAEVTLVRTAVAGLFCGKWWWIHPVTISRVDRSEPAATRNEIRYRRRRLEFMIAAAFGWIPGLVLERVVGPGDPSINKALLVLTAAALAVYLFRSLRRFDREGRERFVMRTIAEGQERIDSITR